MSSREESDTDSISSTGTTKGRPSDTLSPTPLSRQPVTPGLNTADKTSTMSLNEGTDSVKVFGTGIQQFAQRLSAALARFNVSVQLSDSNFNDWAPPIVESLQTLCLNAYLTNPNHHEESMSMSRHDKL